MKNYYLFAFLFLQISLSAQIVFEKAYFVKNNGEKVDCLIKNMDWKNNPESFTYKLTEQGEPQSGNINTVKEFGIVDQSKYIKREIEISRSSDNIPYLDKFRNAKYIKDTLFLKVEVEGEMNLYSFYEQNFFCLFYNIGDAPIKQLVWKRYKNSKDQILANKQYVQQLIHDKRCDEIPEKRIQNLDYKLKKLAAYAVDFNNCFGGNTSSNDWTKKVDRDIINVRFTPGLNLSSLKRSTLIEEIDESGLELKYRLGLEVEFVLGFNKNKWRIVMDPNYQYFKSGKLPEFNYQSIELPIGVRYYMYLNDDSRVFLNALFSFDFSLNSRVYERSGVKFAISHNARNNYSFGLGYNYKQFSIEVRQYLPNEIAGDDFIWLNLDYKKTSIIVSYTFLQK